MVAVVIQDLLRSLGAAAHPVRVGGWGVVKSRKGELLVVQEGAVLRQRLNRGGAYSSPGIYFAGDIINLREHFGYLPETERLVALAGSVVGAVPPTAVHDIVVSAGGRLSALAPVLARELAIAEERLVNLAHRSAPGQMAHFLCEAAYRVGGIAARHPQLQFTLNVTQEMLGTFLGLSSVHINRTLSYLREKDLVVSYRGKVVIRDFSALAHFAGFDPDYLGLDKAETEESVRPGPRRRRARGEDHGPGPS